jgi:hypothetical protein
MAVGSARARGREVGCCRAATSGAPGRACLLTRHLSGRTPVQSAKDCSVIITLVAAPHGAACAGAPWPWRPLDQPLPMGFRETAVDLGSDGGQACLLYRCGVVDMDIKAQSKIPGLPLCSCGYLRAGAECAPATRPRRRRAPSSLPVRLTAALILCILRAAQNTSSRTPKSWRNSSALTCRAAGESLD